MLDWIRRHLTQTITVQFKYGRGRKVEKVVVPPGEGMVYGVAAALIFFIGLLILEIIYMILFGKWSPEVFQLITFIVGVLIGAFFTGGRR
ncbi:MAG: hypothetical protein ACE5GD_10305 [Candidatus Geothermarchaeales archaeon]